MRHFFTLSFRSAAALFVRKHSSEKCTRDGSQAQYNRDEIIRVFVVLDEKGTNEDDRKEECARQHTAKHAVVFVQLCGSDTRGKRADEKGNVR